MKFKPLFDLNNTQSSPILQPNLELDLIAPDSVEQYIGNLGSTKEYRDRSTNRNLTANLSEAFKEISPIDYSLYALDIGASELSTDAEALLKVSLKIISVPLTRIVPETEVSYRYTNCSVRHTNRNLISTQCLCL